MTSLRNKIAVGYAVIIVSSGVTSIVSLILLTQLGSTVGSILQENYLSVRAAENMVKAVQRQENAQISMFAGDLDLGSMLLKENRDLFLVWYDKGLKRASLPEEVHILDSVMVTYKIYMAQSDSLQSMLEAGAPPGMCRNYQFIRVRPTVEYLKEQCFRLLEVNQEAILTAEQGARSRSLEASYLILIASGANIVLSVVAGVYFTRRIVKPVTELTGTVRHIGQGRLDQKIDIRSNDEIGELSREFNKMTERLRNYEEMNVQNLIAEKNKSEVIVTSISDPVIVVDDEHRIVMLNAAARKVIPFRTNDDPVGRTVVETVSDETWAARLAAPPAGEDTASPVDLLTLGSGADAQYFRPRHRIIPAEQGSASGVVTLLQDVTRFTQLDRMKSEFLAAVSHEFRTPLTSINMSVDILLQDVLGPLNDRQRELLVGAKSDTGRLRKLVQELLDLSKLESGRDKLTTSQLDLAAIVRDAVEPLLLQLEDRGIVLVIEIPADLPQLTADPQKLSWVVTNLVSNAQRYTDRGGMIHISAVHRADFVEVAVHDTGSGIPSDALETIFEPFVQIRRTDESTPGSVGLGLSIARRMVEAHGGTIRAESVPGEGSTFIFTIPLEARTRA